VSHAGPTIEGLAYRDVAKTIDHSLLRPELDDAFVEDGCRLAAEYDVAVADRPDRVEDLGLRAVVAMREADRRSDRHGRAAQDRRGALDVRRSDADRRDVVLGSQPATVLDERVVQLGPEQ
jgi:hypothetical protein